MHGDIKLGETPRVSSVKPPPAYSDDICMLFRDVCLDLIPENLACIFQITRANLN